MGQNTSGVPRITVTLKIFEPMLVPRLRGMPFVVLRSVIEGRSYVERVESFPAVRTFPVNLHINGKGTLPVVEIHVVTATDAQSFSSNSNVKHYASVPVPLEAISGPWQADSFQLLPLETELLTADPGFQPICMWLGLSEGADLSSTVGADIGVVNDMFENASALGKRLTSPKVCIAIYGRRETTDRWDSVVSCQGGAESAAACVAPGPLFTDQATQVMQEALESANRLVCGLHQHLEESRSSHSGFAALENENQQLQASLEQQREKYEDLISWLRGQVEEAARGGSKYKDKEDPELRRLRKQVGDMNEQALKLKEEISQKRAKATLMQQHLNSAKRAKDETYKLFESKEADFRKMSKELGYSSLALEKLRQRIRELRGESSCQQSPSRSITPRRSVSPRFDGSPCERNVSPRRDAAKRL